MNSESETETPDFTPPWVLCVDDEPNCLSGLHRFFRNYRVRFSSAYNAVQAFSRITQKKPDLIISDVMMPGVRGTELVAWLRNNTMVREIPLIILTGHGSDKLATGAMEAGAKRISGEAGRRRDAQERSRALHSAVASTHPAAGCARGWRRDFLASDNHVGAETMKGIVFTELIEMVESKLGVETADRMIADSQNPPITGPIPPSVPMTTTN